MDCVVGYFVFGVGLGVAFVGFTLLLLRSLLVISFSVVDEGRTRVVSVLYRCGLEYVVVAMLSQ
jgi:hypothetical protein